MEKQDTTYNGWKNRSTWNVMLWMDNEESNYTYYVSEVRRTIAAGKKFGRFSACRVCMYCLGERTPDGIKVDSRLVDYRAIAAAMLESA
jgi:hypothetical protein